MPNKNEEDRRVIQTFANDLTASDDGHEFHYLAGQQEEIGSGRAYDIPFDRFTKAHPESFEGDNAERLWRSISFGRGSSTVLPHSVQIIVLTNGYMTIW